MEEAKDLDIAEDYLRRVAESTTEEATLASQSLKQRLPAAQLRKIALARLAELDKAAAAPTAPTASTSS